MSAEPERDRAEQGRDRAGHRQREQQPEPRGDAVSRRQPGGRVGADTDEGRLAK